MERRALIDERIKTLLTTTDLTFKQIIETLKSENMSASFNTIRRVNRNHVYRKPRYDAKLTPDQRKELIITLINTSKPNLSSLARQFGVCHGSIWYWWDKLTKIKEKNNGIVPGNELPSEFDQSFNYEPTPAIDNSERDEENVYDDYDDMTEEDQQEDNGFSCDPYSDPSDPLDLDYEEDCSGVNEVNYSIKSESTDLELNEEPTFIKNLGEVEIVGRVQAKDIDGEYIKLPIIMYAPVANPSQGWQNFSLISGDSSSSNSTPSTSTGLSGSLNKNQNLNFGY